MYDFNMRVTTEHPLPASIIALKRLSCFVISATKLCSMPFLLYNDDTKFRLKFHFQPLHSASFDAEDHISNITDFFLLSTSWKLDLQVFFP